MRHLDFFSVVVDHDGSCLIYPNNKKLPIKDKKMLQDLSQRKSGVMDMMVDDCPSTLYYGPIDGINWALVVVVPKDDLQKPALTMGIALSAIALLGIFIVWFICRRLRYAE